ncbi:MAG TPA: hypothetical protein DCX32_02005 [Candidatus Moranbacteria bacterium]|nr:MAG: hypothetical protein UW87_C0004G0013 [Candidatus Moranbacteria bacterium GW2011_GWC2_45_10]KKT95471.1 MAG: hypothetical protein UW95_C0001G0035 [Parcubacteria group bacterium GW2011_GWC1_45_14]HAV11296.1 hypothetical protein [Candidatus Moranbacteria bacterium]
MEETTPQSQETKADAAKRWFQDNLRIIVSVIIVVAIAGGIYSYSKRSEKLAVVEEGSQQQTETQEQGTVEIEGEQAGQQVAGTETPKAAEEVQAPVSKETESSFVETAVKGDGVTHLARRALANYLEKNPDSALTKEHKIYIEDYLRKNVGFQERVHPGTTIEFSKELIQNAIGQSKNLNEKQLQNLQKYSALVTSLS